MDMDASGKINKKEWAIASLVIINLITLAALWLTVIRRPSSMPPLQNRGRGGDVREFLLRELNLSPDQAKEFDDLSSRFLASAGPLHDEIRRLKESYIEEMFRPQPEAVKIDALIAEIGAKRGGEETRLLRHFFDMVIACTPEQKAKFHVLLRNFMIMIGALEPSPPPDGIPGPEDGPGGEHRDAPPPLKQR
jgi:hypothetical protein